MIHQGACHCGAVRVQFETRQDPDAIQVRACQCGFCRRRGGKTVSDPQGRLSIHAAPGGLHRYRFGTGTAEFLICTACGGYMAAVHDISGRLYGVLNVVGADIAVLARRAAEPRNFDGEAEADRTARRLATWTPAEIVEEAGNG